MNEDILKDESLAKNTTPEIDLEEDFNTEELLLVGAKTIAGIGIGFIAVILGTTGIGAVLESTLLPTALTKAAGGLAGGAIGLALGISDSRKKRHRCKTLLPC
ncbi:MAG: hypothetical protein HQM15_08345 [Deltaproteobacteria bacterium]|nr:hypothetical protein [Deltaproteobacteria bacterium]